MNNDEKASDRDDLRSLKQVLEPELARLEQLILFHRPQDNDTEFNDYVNKAIYYRDILARINQDLANLNEQ